MAKIDRLGWAAGVSFVSHGVRFGVRVNEPGVLPAVRDRLPPGWKPAASSVVEGLYSLRVAGSGARAGVRHFNLLYAGNARVARALDLDEVLQALEESLDASVAALARRRVF